MKRMLAHLFCMLLLSHLLIPSLSNILGVPLIHAAPIWLHVCVCFSPAASTLPGRRYKLVSFVSNLAEHSTAFLSEKRGLRPHFICLNWLFLNFPAFGMKHTLLWHLKANRENRIWVTGKDGEKCTLTDEWSYLHDHIFKHAQHMSGHGCAVFL